MSGEPPVSVTTSDRSSENDDSRALLQPQDDGKLPGKCEKPGRKVQWLDRNGDNKLAEILIFQPSDVCDSDEDDSDACICGIM